SRGRAPPGRSRRRPRRSRLQGSTARRPGWSWLAQGLVAPGADALVATVVVPAFGDRAGAVADLDLEAGGALHVEAEHPVVVVPAETVGDGELGRPDPVERGTHVVALA